MLSKHVPSITPGQSGESQPLEMVDTRRNKKTPPEAYDIAPPVRDLIAGEFAVVKSSRRLARKYRLPQHVVQDIVLLGLRKPPQGERYAIPALLRRSA